MERHERYDPEDIEHLLSERSFDELLAEERAYVLRHLSGREEYETMRSLLQHMRNEGAARELLVPDDQVRDNVMAAFRAQQQPQWRIWLNSLAALFQAREAYGYWRPALAFGSLAVLLVAGVWFVTTIVPGTHDEVAEVRSLNEEVERVPLSPGKAEVTEGASEERTGNAEQERSGSVVSEVPVDAAPIIRQEEMEKSLREDTGPGTVHALEADDAVRDDGKKEVAAAEAVTDQLMEMNEIRAVQAEELSRNQSAVNVTGAAEGAVRSSAKRSSTLPSKARAMDADPEVWAFLNNGW